MQYSLIVCSDAAEASAQVSFYMHAIWIGVLMLTMVPVLCVVSSSVKAAWLVCPTSLDRSASDHIHMPYAASCTSIYIMSVACSIRLGSTQSTS